MYVVRGTTYGPGLMAKKRYMCDLTTARLHALVGLIHA